jgi:hypothetical protein
MGVGHRESVCIAYPPRGGALGGGLAGVTGRSGFYATRYPFGRLRTSSDSQTIVAMRRVLWMLMMSFPAGCGHPPPPTPPVRSPAPIATATASAAGKPSASVAPPPAWRFVVAASERDSERSNPWRSGIALTCPSETGALVHGVRQLFVVGDGPIHPFAPALRDGKNYSSVREYFGAFPGVFYAVSVWYADQGNTTRIDRFKDGKWSVARPEKFRWEVDGHGPWTNGRYLLLSNTIGKPFEWLEGSGALPPLPKDVKSGKYCLGFSGTLDHHFQSSTSGDGIGVVTACDENDGIRRVVRWASGKLAGDLEALPSTERYQMMTYDIVVAVISTSPDDIDVFANSKGKPQLAHFDGKAWALQQPPPTDDSIGAAARAPDGTLWLATVGLSSHQLRVFQRARDGQWRDETASLPEGMTGGWNGEVSLWARTADDVWLTGRGGAAQRGIPVVVHRQRGAEPAPEPVEIPPSN